MSEGISDSGPDAEIDRGLAIWLNSTATRHDRTPSEGIESMGKRVAQYHADITEQVVLSVASTVCTVGTQIVEKGIRVVDWFDLRNLTSSDKCPTRPIESLARREKRRPPGTPTISARLWNIKLLDVPECSVHRLRPQQSSSAADTHFPTTPDSLCKFPA
ncbi:hypothetical protein VTN31DRAFT_4616 [Thermomyces dupontii]|uniref:uncharacterized protein n=1 Tax=Talaromyces thermophilus TaxID=28565 RepID=UPI003743E89D